MRFAPLMAFMLVGCGAFGHRAVMSVDEYADYRRFRVAPSIEAKLGAGYEYLRRNPTGYYRPEVSAWFSREQPLYVTSAWNDNRKLRTFLGEVPAGPESERAAHRLAELEMTGAYRSKEE